MAACASGERWVRNTNRHSEPNAEDVSITSVSVVDHLMKGLEVPQGREEVAEHGQRPGPEHSIAGDPPLPVAAASALPTTGPVLAPAAVLVSTAAPPRPGLKE